MSTTGVGDPTRYVYLTPVPVVEVGYLRLVSGRG